MNLWKRTFIFSLAVALVSCPPAYAQNERLKELLLLDIEDLLTVSVASKREESVRDAPGIINVITQDDIKRYGANTIQDLLARVPNLYIAGSSFFPDNVPSIRGQTLTHIDNHILTLLDGRPIRESFVGGINYSVYNAFPLSAVEKIEIIRGPGSVLYGTNAFAGVINIITKKGLNRENAAQVTYGSFGTKQIETTGYYDYAGASIYGAVKLHDNDGWDFTFTDVNNVHDTGEYGQHYHGVMVKADYHGFSFSGFKAQEKSEVLSTSFTFPFVNTTLIREMYNLGYQHEINKNWKLDFNITNNRFQLSDETDNTRRKNIDYLYEVTIAGSVTDKINLVAGGTYDNRSGSFKSDVPSYGDYLIGLYGQADYRITDWLKLVAGMQMNKPEDIKKDFSPRLGAILNFKNHWGVKLLYGEAFRSGNGTEKNSSAVFLFGNSNLKPEKIETIDAQIFYDNNKYSASLTYYQSTIKDTIVRASLGGGKLQFQNGGEIDFHGIEFESSAQITNRFNVNGSVSYQVGEDNNGTPDIGFIPNFMAKIGADYEFDNGIVLGIHNAYYGEPASTKTFNPSVASLNPSESSHMYMTMNIHGNLGQLSGYNALDHVEFSLYGENLLNEDVNYTEVIRKIENTVPQRAGRAMYGTISIKF